MTTKQINDFIREKWSSLSLSELSTHLGLSRDAISKRANRMGLTPKVKTIALPPTEAIEKDIANLKEKQNKLSTEKKYEALMVENEKIKAERDAIKQIASVETYEINPHKSHSSEATAVVLASDWHVEETVNKNTVNGLNEYNEDIAKQRAEKFFANTLRLVQLYSKDIKIKNLVLALLGDFISGQIHDELMEGNSMRPIEALLYVQNIIASGIQHLLDNSDLNITIPCHSGNHGRSTQKQRHATESGNSFEYYMYHNLANHFKDNKRVKFIIPEGYMSYVTVYDTVIRFHHGHNIKYGGGIGGLFIPAFKAISQWNKSRWATIDCFGHLHQFKYGGNFICNGSLIGYNAYAVSIKADFEKPMQTFFLVNKEHGVEVLTKIRLD